MLKQLSRLERTRNIVILAFVGLMAVSLVFFYAPGRNSGAAAPANTSDVIAEVNGDDITVGDLNQIKERYLQYFGGQISIAQLGGDRRLLDGLIRDRVVAQEAARLGLGASDQEVANEIRKQFKDEKGVFVGNERYRETVNARYGGVANFEKGIRDQIASEKLRAFVTSGITVSEDEVRDDYKRKNTSFDLVYVPVTADKLATKLNPSDDELRAYYDAHKTDYRILEPQKKIKYVFIDQAKAGEKLQISDADLKAEYDKLSPENKMAGVKVQQIMLKVARPDLDGTVRTKADELVAKLRGGGGENVSAEAFADAAKGSSEDPNTAKGGGWLSGPVRKNPNLKEDPLQKVFELTEGQITDPIKYRNNYFILRRGEAVPKSFEDAKQELVVSMRNRRAYGVAAKLADRAHQLLQETKDPQKVADQLAGEANMSPAEMVRETPFVKPGDDVPNIGANQQFEEKIAPLNNAGDVGEQTGVKNGFAIPMLVDKKDPRIPEFDEVKDKVAQAVKQERAKQQLEQTAQQLASSASSAGDLKAAAEKLGLTAETADAFHLGTPLGVAGTSAAADDAIYKLNAGQVSNQALKIGDNWVVVGVNKRTDADLAEFSKERDSLMQAALSERRSQVFDDYIGAVLARMKREGKIKVDDAMLARLASESETADIPRPPQG